MKPASLVGTLADCSFHWSFIVVFGVSWGLSTAPSAVAQDTGLRGRVLERLPNGGVGDGIAEASITFRSEDGTVVRSTSSAGNGAYGIDLPPGRYIVTASRQGYSDFTTDPGFFVVDRGRRTANIMMERVSGAGAGVVMPTDRLPSSVAERVRRPASNERRVSVPSKKVAAASPEGGLVVVADDAVLAEGVPAAMQNKLREYIRAGKEIDVVAFAPNGEWIILAEDWRYYSHKRYFDEIGIRPKIEQYLREGKRFDALAFASTGDWVVVAEDYRYYSTRSGFDRMGLRPALEELRRQGRGIDAIVITPNNGWIILSGETYRSRNLPRSLVETLRGVSENPRAVAVGAGRGEERSWVAIFDRGFVARYVRANQCTGLRDILQGDNACSILGAEEERPAEQPVATTPFSILTYNVYMRPLPFLNGQRKRVDLLLPHLTGYDVIVFNELFHEVARRDLLDGLRSEYSHQTDVLGRSSPKEDGGVVIVSRWPIEVQDERRFGRDCVGEDCLAAKGILYARILKEGRPFHVFGTHLQAGGGSDTRRWQIRKAQIGAIREFIDYLEIPVDEPVLIAGDMNVNMTEDDGKMYRWMLDRLAAEYPVGRVALPTRNPGVNDLDDGTAIQFLDYVLVSKNHLSPVEAAIEVLHPRSSTRWRTNALADWHRDLSDHFPVLGRFEFP